MITLSAPAKVNLWLRLGEVRPDGYQELDTAFVPLELADKVWVGSGGREQTCVVEARGKDVSPVEGVPEGPENLAWRAARLFMERLGRSGEGFDVRVAKAIPSGAGLGGGSSDAAAVLRALARLHPGAVSVEDLHEIASALGSDVPFFLLERPARGRGRGELLEPIAAPWQGALLLIKPPFGVSTAWAYRAYRACGSHRARGLPGGHGTPVRNGSLGDGAFLWQNDLEPAVFGKYLLLATLKEWLIGQPGVTAAMMCGSGSTLLAALETPAAGPPLRARVREEFGSTFWLCLTHTA